MYRRLILCLGVVFFRIAGAQPSEDWAAINLVVVDSEIIPRYATFAEAGANLKLVAGELCRNVDGNFEVLRQAYHRAMDAWQAIQHVQFGPITYFNWNYRLQYWPDENGTGARQITALLATADPEVLTEENFERQSVGVQGFPALERMLFEENSLQQLLSDDYRCRYTRTVAENIGTIAVSVHQRWVDEFRTTVANADERGFFESAEDATIDILKGLVESVPRLRDQKLSEPLGQSFASARSTRAESWRSQRSLRNIRINLAVLEQLLNGSAGEALSLGKVFHEVDVELATEKFAEAQRTADPLPDSMVVALENEEGYSQLSTLREKVDELFEAIETSLKNTDLYLGFNSLDGD